MRAEDTRPGGRHVAVERGAIADEEPVVKKCSTTPARAPLIEFLSQRSLLELERFFFCNGDTH